MSIKLYVLISLLILALAYTQEGAILVLKNEDLPTIKQTFPYLLIKYYVPWCQHCQKLAPIYQKLAQRLKEENSPVRIAKINCEEQEKGYEFGDVQQFPTLKYYSEGEVVQFDGDRTFNYLYKWITKRYKSPITKITHQEYQSLKNGDNEVKVVYWGSLTNSRGSQFTTLAYYDHYNQYYQLEDVDPENEGNIQIVRSFDRIIREKVQQGSMQSWVRQHDRPIVVDLDQRSIFSVFVEKRNAILFFIQSKYSQKKSIFVQAAKLWRRNHSQLFIVVEDNHEDYFGLMEYLELNPLTKPIVYISSEQSRKYILNHQIASIETLTILEFLKQLQQKIIPGLPLQNQDHHHHHDHDHEHHHHHHHHHDHDHDHHHHHHDQDHNHQHHTHDGEHADCGCKHHKHHHKQHAPSPSNQDEVKQNKEKSSDDVLLGQRDNSKINDQGSKQEL